MGVVAYFNLNANNATLVMKYICMKVITVKMIQIYYIHTISVEWQRKDGMIAEIYTRK